MTETAAADVNETLQLLQNAEDRAAAIRTELARLRQSTSAVEQLGGTVLPPEWQYKTMRASDLDAADICSPQIQGEAVGASSSTTPPPPTSGERAAPPKAEDGSNMEDDDLPGLGVCSPRRGSGSNPGDMPEQGWQALYASMLDSLSQTKFLRHTTDSPPAASGRKASPQRQGSTDQTVSADLDDLLTTQQRSSVRGGSRSRGVSTAGLAGRPEWVAPNSRFRPSTSQDGRDQTRTLTRTRAASASPIRRSSGLDTYPGALGYAARLQQQRQQYAAAHQDAEGELQLDSPSGRRGSGRHSTGSSEGWGQHETLRRLQAANEAHRRNSMMATTSRSGGSSGGGRSSSPGWRGSYAARNSMAGAGKFPGSLDGGLASAASGTQQGLSASMQRYHQLVAVAASKGKSQVPQRGSSPGGDGWALASYIGGTRRNSSPLAARTTREDDANGFKDVCTSTIDIGTLLRGKAHGSTTGKEQRAATARPYSAGRAPALTSTLKGLLPAPASRWRGSSTGAAAGSHVVDYSPLGGLHSQGDEPEQDLTGTQLLQGTARSRSITPGKPRVGFGSGASRSNWLWGTVPPPGAAAPTSPHCQRHQRHPSPPSVTHTLRGTAGSTSPGAVERYRAYAVTASSMRPVSVSAPGARGPAAAGARPSTAPGSSFMTMPRYASPLKRHQDFFATSLSGSGATGAKTISRSGQRSTMGSSGWGSAEGAAPGSDTLHSTFSIAKLLSLPGSGAAAVDADAAAGQGGATSTTTAAGVEVPALDFSRLQSDASAATESTSGAWQARRELHAATVPGGRSFQSQAVADEAVKLQMLTSLTGSKSGTRHQWRPGGAGARRGKSKAQAYEEALALYKQRHQLSPSASEPGLWSMPSSAAGSLTSTPRAQSTVHSWDGHSSSRHLSPGSRSEYDKPWRTNMDTTQRATSKPAAPSAAVAAAVANNPHLQTLRGYANKVTAMFQTWSGGRTSTSSSSLQATSSAPGASLTSTSKRAAATGGSNTARRNMQKMMSSTWGPAPRASAAAALSTQSTMSTQRGQLSPKRLAVSLDGVGQGGSSSACQSPGSPSKSSVFSRLYRDPCSMDGMSRSWRSSTAAAAAAHPAQTAEEAIAAAQAALAASSPRLALNGGLSNRSLAAVAASDGRNSGASQSAALAAAADGQRPAGGRLPGALPAPRWGAPVGLSPINNRGQSPSPAPSSTQDLQGELAGNSGQAEEVDSSSSLGLQDLLRAYNALSSTSSSRDRVLALEQLFFKAQQPVTGQEEHTAGPATADSSAAAAHQDLPAHAGSSSNTGSDQAAEGADVQVADESETAAAAVTDVTAAAAAAPGAEEQEVEEVAGGSQPSSSTADGALADAPDTEPAASTAVTADASNAADDSWVGPAPQQLPASVRDTTEQALVVHQQQHLQEEDAAAATAVVPSGASTAGVSASSEVAVLVRDSPMGRLALELLGHSVTDSMTVHTAANLLKKGLVWWSRNPSSPNLSSADGSTGQSKPRVKFDVDAHTHELGMWREQRHSSSGLALHAGRSSSSPRTTGNGDVDAAQGGGWQRVVGMHLEPRYATSSSASSSSSGGKKDEKRRVGLILASGEEYPLELAGPRDWAGVVLGVNALLLLAQAAAEDVAAARAGQQQLPGRVDSIQHVKVQEMSWHGGVHEVLL